MGYVSKGYLGGRKKTPLAADIKQEAMILNHTQVMRLDPNKSSERDTHTMDRVNEDLDEP